MLCADLVFDWVVTAFDALSDLAMLVERVAIEVINRKAKLLVRMARLSLTGRRNAISFFTISPGYKFKNTNTLCKLSADAPKCFFCHSMSQILAGAICTPLCRRF